MSGRARRRGAATAALLVPAFLLGGAASASAPTSPDESPTPTTQQLAAAVRVYDPAGSVRQWRLDGAVSTLEVETTEGEQTVLTLDADILFDFASADITPAAVGRLGELLTDVPQGVAVEITGHTDAVGDDASNLDLSQRRAQAVADAIAVGRGDLALRVEGRGEAEPVAPNTTGGQDDPEGREQNRRVEVRYTG